MQQFRAYVWAWRWNSPTAVVTDASSLADFLIINNARREAHSLTLNTAFAFVKHDRG